VGEAIDYFFENVFRKGDQIVVLTEGTLFPIETGKGLSKVAQDLKDTLARFKVISTAQSLKAYKDLRYEADRLLAALRGTGRDVGMQWERSVLRFYENYQRIWMDYKKQFITPDASFYYNVLNKIKYLEGEKWALCFQQREMFPRLKKEGSLDFEIRQLVDAKAISNNPVERANAQTIRSKQMELQRIFDVSTDMPTEALKDLFLEGNITFHLILLKSSRNIVERDFELKEVSRDYEDCFRQISFSTGGHSVFSNKVVEAMEEVSKTEDHYYLLVYSPKKDQLDKPVDIKVKVKGAGLDVVHLKNMTIKRIAPLSIVKFKARKKTIEFSLMNYQRLKMEGQLRGIAQVKITLFDENSEKAYDEVKTLQLVKEQIHISIPFNQLKSGPYFIIIQVIDKITNRMDVFSKQIKL
jgi:hypothetical protein